MRPTRDLGPIGYFLWQRIRQLGVKHILGVPGDMNLELLGYIDDVDGLDWGQYKFNSDIRLAGSPGSQMLVN
ncbi:hypothetical protein F5884DRAFT_861927 [Xylogone sp. PMI_703]|nr:hypothetical protein F5884DRAFT_861927 [Xylogone sp. PMI_703]